MNARSRALREIRRKKKKTKKKRSYMVEELGYMMKVGSYAKIVKSTEVSLPPNMDRGFFCFQL